MIPNKSANSPLEYLQRRLLEFPADTLSWQALGQMLATALADAELPSATPDLAPPPPPPNPAAPAQAPMSRHPVAQVIPVQKIQNLGAESADAIFRQAKTLSDAADFQGCITLVENCIKRSGELAKDPMLAFIQAHALRNVGQMEQALEVLLPFRNTAPTPWIPFELGLIFKCLNRPNDAYLCLKEARGLEPEFTWAAIEAAAIVSHTNIPLGRLDKLTAAGKGERDSLELTIDRILRFGNLLLVIGWSAIPGSSGTRMRLLDPLVPAKVAAGGSCYYRRPDVNQAIGSEDHNLHGFTSLIDCSILNRWSEVGQLELILEPPDGGELRTSNQHIRLCDIKELPGFDSMLEALLGSVRIAIDSGTAWHDAIRMFTPHTIQICSQLFSSYARSVKPRSEVHWLNNKNNDKPTELSFVFVQLGSFEVARPAISQICKLDITMEIIVVNNSIKFFSETFHILNRLAGLYKNIRFGIINNACNIGFSAACNIGAANSTGKFIFFHNNDLFANAKDDYWTLLQRAIAHPNAIHSAYQYFTDGTLMQEGIAITQINSNSSHEITIYNGYSIGRNQGKGEILACSGSLILMSRSNFDKLNGFSEAFIYAHFEDIDLCLRARQQNIPIYIWDDITFFHAEGGGTGAPYHLTGTTGHVNRLLFSMRWQKVLQSMHTEVEYVL
jgi:GT2 family glycosyltransferase